MRASRKCPLRALLTALCLVLSPVLFLGGCSVAGDEVVADDLAIAHKAMLRRDFLEAEKSFERYLKREPEGAERWEVWNNLTELALSMRGDRKAAIELLEAMLIEYAGVPARKREISARLADLYRLSRMYGRAVVLWSSIAEDPMADSVERARACRNLAHVYLRRLEFELAKESLGYCLSLDIPDTIRGECLYDLAQTSMGMDETETAIIQLRTLLALRNVSPATRTLTVFMLADALDQKGQDEEAMRLFSGLGETYPNRKVVERRIEFLRKKKENPSK